MQVVTITQTDAVSLALRNFALDIHNGTSFEYAVATGALFTDTKEEEEQYAVALAVWKLGKLKIEIETIKESDSPNVEWQTIVVANQAF